MLEDYHVVIAGSAGKPMAVEVRWTKGRLQAPVLVFVHGFKGFKDWGPFPLACDVMAAAGFVVVSFNFSHNGTTPEAPADFADLEAFGQNNYTKELDDLGRITDWICSKDFAVPAGVADVGRLFLLGHSRGGGDVIIKAAEDKRIKAIVTWAAVEAFGQWFDTEELAEWQKEGVIYTYNSRTGQHMPMYYQMREDFLAHRDRLDIPAAGASLDIPWLIIHGDADPTVPVSAAHNLHMIQPHSKLRIIEGGDHTFGGRHPWKNNEMPPLFKIAVAETLQFLRQIN